MEHLLLYSGKVREVFDLGKSHLLMKATDRVSCFDKNVGVIPGKGELLNKMSEFWFNQTMDIIDYHLINCFSHSQFYLLCIRLSYPHPHFGRNLPVDHDQTL